MFRWSVPLVGLALLGAGCSCFPKTWCLACREQGWPVKPGEDPEKDCAEEPEGPHPSALPVLGTKGECYRYRIRKKIPRTLFEWQLCKEEEKEDCEDEGDKEEEEKNNGEKKENGNGAKENGDAKKNGNRDTESKEEGEKKNGKKNGKDGDDWEIEYEEPLESDRPDFTEASSTVPKGRVQLEMGYTFIRDDEAGTELRAHSYPELLCRIGLTEWLELRIGQNFASERTAEPDEEALLIIDSVGGAEDLYLGVKLGLTEQQKVLPEMALILQMTVPTGSEVFTAGEVHPGVNFLYGWDIIEDCLSLGGSTQMNRSSSVITAGFASPGRFSPDPPEEHHPFYEMAQSLTVGYTLTKRLGAYTEWFALFPSGSIDPEIGPQYYFDGGFTYKLSNNIQFDVRLGVGLNRHADDLFTGSGMVVRY